MIPGQQCAVAPTSPHPNISVTGRAGSKPCGAALWTLECTCGYTAVSMPKYIARGSARCSKCNPHGAEQMAAILAVMPAGYARIMSVTKLTRTQAEVRLRAMRTLGMCHIGKWKRPTQQGSYSPIFHAGAGADEPCDLEAIDTNIVKRKHEQRVRKAVAVAMAGGRKDPRYLRHITRREATVTVWATRATPQHPFSALFQTIQEGAAC